MFGNRNHPEKKRKQSQEEQQSAAQPRETKEDGLSKLYSQLTLSSSDQPPQLPPILLPSTEDQPIQFEPLSSEPEYLLVDSSPQTQPQSQPQPPQQETTVKRSRKALPHTPHEREYSTTDLQKKIRSDGRKLEEQSVLMESLKIDLKDKDDIVRGAKEGEREAREEVRKLEEKLILARENLNASRAFVDISDSNDVASLLTEVKSINSWVDDTSFQLFQTFENLSQTSLDNSLNQSMISSFTKKAEEEKEWKLILLGRLYLKKGWNGADFLMDVYKSVLFRWLHRHIFHPFKIGIDPPNECTLGDTIDKLYIEIQNKFPQDRSARWRSLTYSALPPHPSFSLPTYLRTTLTTLLTLLSTLSFSLLSIPPSSTAFLSHLPPILSRMTLINSFQTKLRTQYLSWDYLVFRAEAGESEEKGGKVLGCRGFGLARVRVTERGGEIKKELEVVMGSENIWEEE